MFETEAFKEQLNDAVWTAAGRNNMKSYQTSIVDFLFDQARNNEEDLMRAEFSKSVQQRRGVSDALANARALVETASIMARREQRNLLTRADVEAAYRANYCSVWPFCK